MYKRTLLLLTCRRCIVNQIAIYLSMWCYKLKNRWFLQTSINTWVGILAWNYATMKCSNLHIPIVWEIIIIGFIPKHGRTTIASTGGLKTYFDICTKYLTCKSKWNGWKNNFLITGPVSEFFLAEWLGSDLWLYFMQSAGGFIIVCYVDKSAHTVFYDFVS